MTFAGKTGLAVRRGCVAVSVSELGRDRRLVADYSWRKLSTKPGLVCWRILFIGPISFEALTLALLAHSSRRRGRRTAGARRWTRCCDRSPSLDTARPPLRQRGIASRVDVVVGDVLADDAPEPDHLRGTIRRAHRGLDPSAGHARIAVGVDDAAPGGHQRAVAVALDRAALADEAGGGKADAEELGHSARH